MAGALRILVLHGPNLNLLGSRDPKHYGSMSSEGIVQMLCKYFPEVQFDYFQSNHEGELIDQLHAAQGIFQGVILNAGGYTHTSVSLADAVAAISLPVIEVHLSKIYAREPFRQVSLVASHCVGSISGFGPKGYLLAVHALLE